MVLGGVLFLMSEVPLQDVMADDGSVVTYLVAAALVSISGMRETLKVKP